MTRIGWWIGLVFFSMGVVGLDIVTGPHVLFPVTFVIPVCLGAWYLGRGAGIGFAVGMVGCRLVIAMALEGEMMPSWAAISNAGIRLLVLVGLAVLVGIARQKQALAERVRILEGLLTICAFCKRIRLADGTWEHIEPYISKRSAAQFSHGLCEACAQEHYGQYRTAPNGGDTDRGAGPERGGR